MPNSAGRNGYRNGYGYYPRPQPAGCPAFGVRAAALACHLARAAGIPAILVKSLLRDEIAKHDGTGRIDGHVWVEVLLDGKPALWNTQAEGGIHTEYDPHATVFVEGKKEYIVYQKGDPDELSLSHHGDRQWEAENRSLWSTRR